MLGFWHCGRVSTIFVSRTAERYVAMPDSNPIPSGAGGVPEAEIGAGKPALVYMSGIQALVQLPLLQKERDRQAGLNTAGFISGYRGSPLGGLDQALWKAKARLEANDIAFQPGVNEELGATAVWGTQQVNLFPGPRFDGVFGLWYGKGPGVDRSIDVFKHANAAGTSPHGGVLVIAGDDHGAKSSTLPHQSDHVLAAAMIPVLNPSGGQEFLDFGLHGWAMSRYSGCWVALRAIADTVETSSPVLVDAHRVETRTPTDFILPPDGVSIRWPDQPLAQELRLQRYKVYAAMAYARLNGLNRIVIDSPRARLGIISTGKSYLDVRQALDSLGIDHAEAAAIGIRLFKVGMTWPLDAEGVRAFCGGTGGNPCRRGEAAAHRVPAQGAALQLARGRAAARDRQIRRDGRMGAAASMTGCCRPLANSARR